MSFQILRTAKLTTWGQIGASAEHTYRERPTPNANSSLAGFNQHHLAKSAAQVRQAIEQRIEGLEVKHDTVKCIEYLITASPEFFKGKEKGMLDGAALISSRLENGLKNATEKKTLLRFQYITMKPRRIWWLMQFQLSQSLRIQENECCRWVRFGRQAKTQNNHGRKARTKMLSAKHFLGGREKLSEMQTEFNKKVAGKFGLERGQEGSRATHQKVQRFYSEMVRLVERQQQLNRKVEQEDFENSVVREHLQGQQRKLAEDAKKLANDNAVLNAKLQAFSEKEMAEFQSHSEAILNRAREAAEAWRGEGKGSRVRPIKP